MYSVPACQNSSPRSPPSSHHTSPSSTFHSHPRGSSGTSAPFSWPYLPVHYYRQDYTLARSDSSLHYVRRRLRSRPAQSCRTAAQHTFHGSIIHGDTSTGVFRPYVPVELRPQIFQHVHGLAHPGSRATRRLISARYVWSHLARDVTAWCQQCVACQRAKIHRHVRRPPHIYQYQQHVSLTSTWISWDLCPLPLATPTCLPLLTGLPAGPKQFLSPLRPPPIAQPP